MANWLKFEDDETDVLLQITQSIDADPFNNVCICI